MKTKFKGHPLLGELPVGDGRWAEVPAYNVDEAREAMKGMARARKWTKYVETAANLKALGYRLPPGGVRGYETQIRGHVDFLIIVKEGYSLFPHLASMVELGLRVDEEYEKSKHVMGEDYGGALVRQDVQEGTRFSARDTMLNHPDRYSRGREEVIRKYAAETAEKGGWADLAHHLWAMKKIGMNVDGEVQRYGPQLVATLDEKAKKKRWYEYITIARHLHDLDLLTPATGKQADIPPLKEYGK